MSRTLDEIKSDIDSLPEEEKYQLIDWIYDNGTQSSEKKMEEHWAEVAQNRLAEIESGERKTVSGEEVEKSLREQFGF